MNMKKMTGKIFIFLFILTTQLQLKAQTVVNAYVDKNVVSLNESLTLTITITGESITNAKPDMPQMANFDIYSAGRSSNISIINGRITTALEFTYILTPRYVGKTKIPSILITTMKERLYTKEIEITVVKATNQQANAQTQQQTKQSYKNRPQKGTPLENLVFVKAWVDKKKAYIGEQINLTFRFYTSVPIASNPQYFPPKLLNLIAEDLPPTRNGEEVINGIRYYYSEIKTALFGLNAGKANIGPVQIIAQVQKEEDIDPFDPNFMQKFFSGFSNYEELKMQTKPITLDIEPMPQPQPNNFSGSVGNFFISAEADRKQANQGEPINLSLKISGKGNIKDIQPPDIANSQIKIYDTLSSYKITKNNDIIGGEKTITYIISFKEEGEKEIPPISFTFFNPDLNKYETINTQPIKIKVLKSENTKTYDFSQSNTNLKIKGEDIKYIHNLSSNLYLNTLSRINKFSVYPYSILSIFFIFSLLKSYQTNVKFKNPILYAFKTARNKLNNQIKSAQKEADSGNYSKALSLIYDALMDYISAKIAINIYSMPIKKIIDNIKQKYPNINEFSLNEISSLLENIEFLNYAPSSINSNNIKELIDRIDNLIEIFEKEIHEL